MNTCLDLNVYHNYTNEILEATIRNIKAKKYSSTRHPRSKSNSNLNGAKMQTNIEYIIK
jgi:hypothetical protein